MVLKNGKPVLQAGFPFFEGSEYIPLLLMTLMPVAITSCNLFRYFAVL